jgi:hypothetical protein
MGHILGKCAASFDFETLVEELCAAIRGTMLTNTDVSWVRIARQ